jgi:hypothetical protein
LREPRSLSLWGRVDIDEIGYILIPQRQSFT